jgi:hypothetical protein
MASLVSRCGQWFDQNLKGPFLRLSNHQRLAACAVGVVGGMFPIPMVTTLVTMALAFIMSLTKLQITVSVAVNLLCAPVDVMFIPTQARFAAWFTGASSESFTASALMAAMQEGIVAMLSTSASMLVHAVIGWSVFFLWILLAVRLTKPSVIRTKIDDRFNSS